MIGWHPKKKVTLIQIAHWLPVLIEEFLFPRFYSFTLRSTLNACWAHFSTAPSSSLLIFLVFGVPLGHLAYFILFQVIVSVYTLKMLGIVVRIKLFMGDSMEIRMKI